MHNCNGICGVCEYTLGYCPKMLDYSFPRNQGSEEDGDVAVQTVAVAVMVTATAEEPMEVVMNNPNPNPATPAAPASDEIILLEVSDIEVERGIDIPVTDVPSMAEVIEAATNTTAATPTTDPGAAPEVQADREAARTFLENVVAKVLNGIARATPKVDLTDARKAEAQAKTALEERPRKAKFFGYQALSLGNQAQGLWNLDQAQSMLEANPVESGTALLGAISKLRKVLSQSVDKIGREVRNLSQAAFEIRKRADEMTGKVRANKTALDKAKAIQAQLEAKLAGSADLAEKFGSEVAGIATFIAAGAGFDARRKAEALDLTISLRETGVDVSGCDFSSWDFSRDERYERQHRDHGRGDRREDPKSRERRENDRARTLATKGPSGGGGSGHKHNKKGK